MSNIFRLYCLTVDFILRSRFENLNGTKAERYQQGFSLKQDNILYHITLKHQSILYFTVTPYLGSSWVNCVLNIFIFFYILIN